MKIRCFLLVKVSNCIDIGRGVLAGLTRGKYMCLSPQSITYDASLLSCEEQPKIIVGKSRCIPVILGNLSGSWLHHSLH